MSFDASQLYDPSSWSDNDAIHKLFAQMRAEDPVHFCESTIFPDLWHVTKHADIFDVERRTKDFLNEPRLIIFNREQETQIREETGGSLNRIRSLVTYDAPEHMKLRLLTQSWFMPKNLSKLQSKIGGSVERAFSEIGARDGNCDFASDVATEYPLRVIMDVLGVPEGDYGMLLRLTQELFGPEDPDTRRDVEEGISADAAQEQTILEMFAYFTELTKAKMADPKDDVASIVANAVVDGEPLDDMAKLGYYIIVATAGHDTTSYSLSEAVHQLAKDPELFARLKSDPDTVAPLVTEEAIRYASAVRHFIRTAAHDTTLGGKPINAGESVILWYPSGSRDEDVFEDPHHFNIDRDQSTRHAAFGHGAHMCLGMHLARQEITAFLKALAARVDTLKLNGAPKYMQANFVGGIKSLPVDMALSLETVA
ncbi:MAG: cytochrome P450 [Pseudomonadota bacterium]